MASKTTNYGLNKHSPQDFYNVEARNENWDKIDEALAATDPNKITAKAAPADGDGVMIADSADGGKAKRLLWSSVKEALEQVFGDVRTAVSRHIVDKSNPHGVTAEQVGAYSKEHIDEELKHRVKAMYSDGMRDFNNFTAGTIQDTTFGTDEDQSPYHTPYGELGIKSPTWCTVITIGMADNRLTQFAVMPFSHEKKAYIRYQHDHNWSSWTEIITSGNVGNSRVAFAQRALDADGSSAYQLLRLRNTRLVQTESTPGEGEIDWQYG